MFGSTQCHYKVVRMQQLPHPPCTAFLFMLQEPHTKLCRPRACNRDFAVSENYATFILNTPHSLPTRPNRSVSIMFQVSHLRPKMAKNNPSSGSGSACFTDWFSCLFHSHAIDHHSSTYFGMPVTYLHLF